MYYYVESKGAILYECVRIGFDMLKQAIREADAAGGTAYEKMIAGARAYAHIETEDFGRCVTRVGEDSLPAESRQKLRRMKAASDGAFQEFSRPQTVAVHHIAAIRNQVAVRSLWVARVP